MSTERDSEGTLVKATTAIVGIALMLLWMFFACTTAAISTVEKYPQKECTQLFKEKVQYHKDLGHLPVDVVQIPDGSFILVFAAPRDLKMHAVMYLPPGVAINADALKVWEHTDACHIGQGGIGNFYIFSYQLQYNSPT